MNRIVRKPHAGMLRYAMFLIALGGCTNAPEHEAAHDTASEAAGDDAPTNRIAIPKVVRDNLGITFASVEVRDVAHTIRAPGSFELLPDARREYRTMAAGRIELHIAQYESVEPGTLLFTIDSPDWRELQAKLAEAESTIRQSEARVSSIPLLMAAHRHHEEILEANIATWEGRVAQLEKARSSGVVTDEEFTNALNTLAVQRAELAEILEKEADLKGQIVAVQAEHDAAHARFRLYISTASSMLGIEESALVAPYDLEDHFDAGIHQHDAPPSWPAAEWRKINQIEVRAQAQGIVESLALTNGAWASAGDLVLSTIEPDRLRFTAMGMQGDLGRLRDGLPARIVPPIGGSVALQDDIPATVTVGWSAEPGERTVELVAVPSKLSAWARPGISAHLEVVVAGGESELAIPLSSVIQDGLAKVIFRRDPDDPNQAIRIEADLGIDDGRWVVVKSGVRAGDQVVLDGVYQLMIATSGSVEKGGHFHADGTFHAGEEE